MTSAGSDPPPGEPAAEAPGETGAAAGEDRSDLPDVPDWEDEYLDRVADRLMHSYDLERDKRVRGRTFPMYGRMLVKNQKQFFVAALRYGYHETVEHLFVQRADAVTVDRLEALVELGHELAEDWITVDEDHFETQFTFVVVAPELPPDVADYVGGFRDRTLLNYGYHGHYEVSLVAVAPGREQLVAGETADVSRAFRFWEADEPEGLVDRLRGLLG